MPPRRALPGRQRGRRQADHIPVRRHRLRGSSSGHRSAARASRSATREPFARPRPARSCRGRRSVWPCPRREWPRCTSLADLTVDMREAGIGRVLVASLHQAIADILPTRLAFYENWLNAEGLREGTIGLALLHAVLSFLRQEGDAYRIITMRAGEYAAEWTVASMPPVQRAIIKAAPSWFRTRLVVGEARRLVRT